MSEIKLRPWQKEAHHKALSWWADESNGKNFIINAAPGAGKHYVLLLLQRRF